MPKLTDPEVARRNLRQSWDPNYADYLFGLMNYQLEGSQGGYGFASSANGEIPDWPMLLPRRRKTGESRRILSHQGLMMMKACYMDPDPEFPDLDDTMTQVRKAWVAENWRGDREGLEGGWAREAHRTFLDADGLGWGCTQVGERNGKIVVEHRSPLNTVIDRLTFNIGRTRFIGFLHHLPVEEAVNMFGSKIAEHATPYGENSETDWNTERPLRVRMFEYHDLGMGKSNPTCIWFLNNFGGEVQEIYENEAGCLPFAFCQHVHFPGMLRPLGRIDLQLASQEMRNALERYMRLTLMRGPGFDAVSDGLSDDDMSALVDGQLLALMRFDSPGPDFDIRKHVQRVGPQEVPATALTLYDIVEREQTTESGNSAQDRGNLSTDQRTLGENKMVQQGADIQTAFSRRQYAEYMKRLLTVAIKYGALYDTAPVQLDVDGITVNFNDPASPMSALSEWLSEPSRVIVHEDTLQYQDPDVQAVQKLNLWQAFLQDPYTNPIELRKMLFKFMGRKDDKLVMDPAAMMAQGQVPMGTPGTPQRAA